MRIASELYEQMSRHGEESYPDEACGLLVGNSGEIRRIHATRNILDALHADDPETYPRTARTGYVIDPQQQFEIMRAAEDGGDEVCGIYHSHADVGAYFSDEDKAQALPFGQPAFPGAVYIVLDVREGRCEGAKAFVWSETDRDFVETPLTIGE